MIERHWKGITGRANAAVYIAHLQHDTFPQLKKITGFISAAILTREVKEGIEFLIVTRWTMMEAIRQFAGADAGVAVVPQAVRDIMLQYDDHVIHYELSVTFGDINRIK